MYEFRPAAERILRMRERIRDRVLRCDSERGAIITEASKKYENIVPIIKRPLMFQEIAKKITTYVDDDEIIVGKGALLLLKPRISRVGFEERVDPGGCQKRQLDYEGGRPVPQPRQRRD